MAEAAKSRKVFDGKYEILEIIGRGAGSVVYQARYIDNHESHVALKVLLSKKNKDTLPLAEKLRREALAILSSRHRFVIRLDDFHTLGEVSYLAMEYAKLGDLRKYVKSHGKLDPVKAELFLKQIAEALSSLHSAGIIHRDIKPDNLLVTKEDEIKLGDFGVTILPGDEPSLEELRSGVGTMDYMAPEVLEGIAYTHLSDIYGLGVTFYEMLSGKHPFADAPIVEQLDVRQDSKLIPLSSVAPEVPQYLSNVIMQAMSYTPENRFSSCKDLLKSLQVNKAQAQEVGSSATQRSDKLSDKIEVSIDKDKTASKPITAPIAAPSTDALGSQIEVKTDTSSSSEDASVAAMLAAMKGIKSEEPQPSAAAHAPNEEQDLFESEMDIQAEESFDDLFGINQDISASSINSEQDISTHKDQFSNTEDVMMDEELEDWDTKIEESVDTSIQPVSAPEPAQVASTATPAPAALRSPDIDKELDKKRMILIGLIALIAFYFASGLIYNTIMSWFGAPTQLDDYAEEAVDAAPGTKLPNYNGEELSFPQLPQGIYAGTIVGLIPGKSHTLTIFSLTGEQLVFVINIEGWTPRVISVAGRELSDNRPVRIAANGLIIDFSAQAFEGELIGRYTIVASGLEGEWFAKPVKGKE